RTLLFWFLVFAAPAAFAQLTWQQALDQHRWDQAEPLLQAAIQQGETPALLLGLTTVYRATGRLSEAEATLEKLASREETADNLEELARVKGALAKFDPAADLYRRSLALRGSSDADQLKSVITHQRLVQILMAVNKFADAETEAQTAITIRTR